MTTPLTIRPTRAGSRIAGVGSFLPRRIVTNEEMCTMIDSSDEWIQQRTGIVERHWASDDEPLSHMIAEASRRAIEHAGIDTDEIDAVIVASVTHLKATPALAPRLAHELGLKDPAAYDISAACAGFCYALAQADALIRTGGANAVLIVGVERLSDLTDKSDRSTAFLFADGAGAAVIVASETPASARWSGAPTATRRDVITQTADFRDAVPTGQMPTLYMDGNPVFRWAYDVHRRRRRGHPEADRPRARAARRLHPAPGEHPHHRRHAPRSQASRARRRRPRHRTAGNTSAASVPMAIDELLTSGEAKPARPPSIIGFGAGLVYAGQVIILPVTPRIPTQHPTKEH